MKRIVKVFLVSLLAISLFACSGGSGVGGANAGKKKPKVEISVKDFGVMQAELAPELAPITVANFLKLVNDGFYNGLKLSRVNDNTYIIIATMDITKNTLLFKIGGEIVDKEYFENNKNLSI